MQQSPKNMLGHVVFRVNTGSEIVYVFFSLHCCVMVHYLIFENVNFSFLCLGATRFRVGFKHGSFAYRGVGSLCRVLRYVAGIGLVEQTFIEAFLDLNDCF